MSKRTRIGIEIVVLLLLAGVFSRIAISQARDPVAADTLWDTSYRSYVGSPSITVGAAVRTFAENASPDFPRTSSSGPGRYMNIMAPHLDDNGDPVFNSTGQRVITPWRDAAGNVIMPAGEGIASRPGDVAGRVETDGEGAVTSRATFNQWFESTSGVNSTSQSDLNFSYSGGKYVFDGSLDGLNGGRNPNYTAELEFPFVHETGRDFYFEAETSAEVWVFINGRLVIDGGGMPAPAFTISNGAVVPAEPVTASVTVVGSAIQSGSTQVPVTLRVAAGSQTFEPFGAFGDPASGNVNDNRNPRNADLAATIAAGTPISVTGTSWLMQSGRLAAYITASSTPATAEVKVLRDGDPVPDIRPFENQASINSYLQPYLNADTGKVTLQAHQTIFLFELGTRSLNTTAADFQDLVVLVNLARVEGGGSEGSGSSGDAASMPAHKQRIDLNRIQGLDDQGSYTIKILFANRTGASSNLRLETNIVTLNLANRPSGSGHD